MAATTAAPLALTAPGDAQGLARRLQELAAQPAQQQRMREAAAGLARERTWPAVAARHLELYEEVQRGDSTARRRLRAA